MGAAPEARPGLAAARAGAPGRVALELAALLLACLLAAGALLLAAGRPERYAVDLTVKEPDTRLGLAGFHIPEANGEFAYRWSRPYAFFQLPGAAALAPGYLATVRLRVPSPDTARRLTFLLNERPVASAVPAPAFRVYRLALPARDDEGGLRLALSAPELRLPGDARPLGVVLTGAALEPLRSAAPADVAWAALCAGLLWALLRLTGSGAGAAALAAGAVGLACAALWALAGPAPLGLALRCALAFGGAGAAALLAREAGARLGLGALCALVAFAGAVWPSWLADDAFISFRYAQNLAEGHGLVYNVGERVEGYTNFLWTVLAALVIRAGGDIAWWSYASGVALALGVVLLTFALARRPLGPAWGLAAALAAATSQPLLIHSARGAGLETGLFTLLALAAALLHLRDPRRPAPWGVGLLLGLATLTRPEGALLLALTALHALARGRGPWRARLLRLAPALAAYAALVLPFFLWRYGYYGDPLPNTFYAKTGGGLRTAARGLVYAAGFALAMGGPALLLALLPGPRADAEAAGEPAGPGSWRAYLLLLAGAYAAYVVSVGGDHFPGQRFFVVAVPWLAALMAAGLARAYGWLRAGALRPAAPALLAVALLAFGGYALFRAPEEDWIVAGSDESLGVWRELGIWLADNAAPGDSVAAMSAGAIAFYSERPTVDMLGLTDRHIARVTPATLGEGPAGHEKRDPAYVLDVRRPTYIPQMWEDYFGGADALRGRYTLVQATTRYGRVIPLWKKNQ